MKILITGTTGESMPPPYGGIPKVSLLYGRTWKRMGNEVGITFTYRPPNANDLGADAEYFFEYASRPNKLKKLFFLLNYFFRNPALYMHLLRAYFTIYPRWQRETFLYAAYGVFIDGVVRSFQPDIILSQTALIKSFMASVVAKRRGIPIVYNTYAEVRDPQMGVNKHLNEEERKRYWTSFLEYPELIIGMSNCSDGPLQYVPKEKVKVFYDTCDFTLSRTPLEESKDELREYFKVSRSAFLVGAVGAFDARKGHDHLIRAIGSLSREGHDVGAMICGAGDAEKWKKLAVDEEVRDRIYFFSNLSEIDLIKLHRSVDAYSNLSNSPRSCGLDLALLEAMASGLPIVVYDNGALPTAVVSGKNGYVVKTDDIEGVAGALLNLYQKTAEERAAMGAASKEIAEKCDINKTAAIKLDWFKEVIANFHKK